MLCQTLFLESWDNVFKTCLLFQQEKDLIITETLWEQVSTRVAFDSTGAWEKGAGLIFFPLSRLMIKSHSEPSCPFQSLSPNAPPFLYISLQLPIPTILALSGVPFAVFGFTAVEPLSAKGPHRLVSQRRFGLSRGLNVLQLCSDPPR